MSGKNSKNGRDREVLVAPDRFARVHDAALRRHDPFVGTARTPVEEIQDKEQRDTGTRGQSDFREEPLGRPSSAMQELADERNKYRMEGVMLFLEDCFRLGPDVGLVMREVYAKVHLIKPEMLRGMTMRQLSKMFDETAAAYCWRRKQVCRRLGIADTGFAGMKGSVANFKGRKPKGK